MFASYLEKQRYEALEPSEGKSPSFKTSYSRVLGYLTLLLSGIAVGLTIGFLCPTRSSSRQSFDQTSPALIPDDVLSPRVPVRFVPDARYVGSSALVDKNWGKLLQGSDEVYLSDPERYNLGKGIHAPWEDPHSPDNATHSRNFYLLSNLHQLHCTNVIRRRYWQLRSHQGVSPSDADFDDWATHVDHCFEYLRLSTTCGDLLVFEPDSPPGTPAELTVDNLGWGITHSCINFDRLLAWQEGLAEEYKSDKKARALEA